MLEGRRTIDLFKYCWGPALVRWETLVSQWGSDFIATSHSSASRYVGSRGGGGVSFGVGAKDVGIVELEASAQGKDFCGGVIGKEGRKMCIGVNCGVEGHRTKEVDLAAVIGKTLFIVTSSNPDTTRSAVHLEPRIPSRTLGGKLARYLQEMRSLDGWDTLFRGIQGTDEDKGVTEGALSNITKRVDGRGGQERYGVTPYKKRPKLEVNSPALEANFELTMPEVEPDLGDSPNIILRNLVSEWKVMANNVNTLKKMVNGCRDVTREKSEATVEEFGELDLEVAR
jgi:hypothetical protein